MEKNETSKFSLLARIGISAVFVILGIIFSNSLFFDEYPLFGIRFLAEILISIVTGLVGFHVIPKYFLIAKKWVEDLIVATTARIVGDFWNQYTSRLEENRRKKQKNNKKEKKKKFKERAKGGIVLDTSILIDGRLLHIAKSGFISVPLVIPKFVISELHLLSDNEDEIKRKKGRRGLDLINALKKIKSANVIIHNLNGNSDGVDKQLLSFAKEYGLKLMTLDFNLNKVAKVANVRVLNINELAEALKPEFVPGEELEIKVVQKGKEKGQGVGYLDDGTMIVVESGSRVIGERVEVVVTKLIQTEAGKMVFCTLKK